MSRSTNEVIEQKWRALADATRNEAAKLPVGSRARDAMLKRVRQLEVACHMSEWISSPGLRSPDETEPRGRPSAKG